MILTRREVSGTVIVGVEGKLIGGPDNSEKFRNSFISLLNEGKKKIVINLRETPWANSQGIGLLIGAHRIVTNAGGELVLAHVVDRINDIFEVSKLLLIFRSFESEDEAVKYLMERN